MDSHAMRSRQEPLTSQEGTEFAHIMDVVLPGTVSRSYDELVSDPIKSLLATSSFYARIKADVVGEVVRRYLGHIPCAQRRILDVGCGTGELMELLEAHATMVWGCDPAAGMVHRAGPTARLMTSGLDIPFDTRSFDIAVCACVYHHIEPPLRPAHLQEIRRVLRPGGILMVFEHNPYNPLTRFIVSRCPIDASASLLPGPVLCNLMETAGFNDVHNRYYLFFPEALQRLLGWLEPWLSVTRLGGQYCTVGRA